MLKPIEKPRRQPLVHHPCDVLDDFCQYDATNEGWLHFDESLSHQLIQFEFNHRQYIRANPDLARRSLSF
jgi:hypothetical protein